LTATLAELVLYGLPEDYFTHYRSKVAAITRADVDRAARTYLNPDHMVILIVGDRAVVEPSLKSLPYAQVINVLTPEGDPLPDPSPTKSEVK
jgi:zinc protease